MGERPTLRPDLRGLRRSAAPTPHRVPTAPEAALVGDGHNLQMDWRQPACGRRSCTPARQDLDVLELARRVDRAALEDWATWGQARHDYFRRPADLAAIDHVRRRTPRGGFLCSNMNFIPSANWLTYKERRNSHSVKMEYQTLTTCDRAQGFLLAKITWPSSGVPDRADRPD